MPIWRHTTHDSREQRIQDCVRGLKRRWVCSEGSKAARPDIVEMCASAMNENTKDGKNRKKKRAVKAQVAFGRGEPKGNLSHPIGTVSLAATGYHCCLRFYGFTVLPAKIIAKDRPPFHR